jgi:uncharacterized protein
MHPFFFGAAERPLFGIYSPANPASYRDAGVVLCYPYGWEYLRSHRAFRQLGVRLSDAGFHALRFDYYGTGDSAGNAWEGNVDLWLEDVSTAVDELKDTTGLRKVSLLGLGLGATLATHVAGKRRDIDRLVLWDPVIDGADHVLELATAHPRLGSASGLTPDLEGAEGAVDVAGFPLSTAACRQLEGIDLRSSPPPRVRSVLTVTTGPDPRCDLLARAFSAQGIISDIRHIPAREHGPQEDDFVNTAMPTEVVDTVVEFFVEAK